MTRHRLFRLVPPLAALALLAACSSTQEASSVRRVCPDLQIVSGADTLTTYRGSGRDLTDVAYTVALTDANFDCFADETSVEGDVTIVFDVRRGPGNETGNAPFEYFVAVVDENRDILARATFDVVVPFATNRGRVTFQEVVSPQIPLPAPDSGGTYSIFLGLEVSREQFDENVGTIQ
jgi:hypothetical protein